MILCGCTKKKEAKDKAILKAAELEFLEKGLQFAAMESIAKQAGVSKATLYKYYPTKEQLFENLVSTLFDQIGERLDYPYSKDLTIEEAFKGVIDFKLSLLSDKRFINLAKMMIIEELKKSNFNNDELKKRFHQGQQYFTQWVEKCQSNGQLSPKLDPAEVSEWFHSMFDGMIFWPLLLGLTEEITDGEQNKYRKIITESFLKTFT